MSTTLSATLSPEALRVSRSDLLVVPCADGCGTEVAVSGSARREAVERTCRACTYRRSHTIICDRCSMPELVTNPRSRFCRACRGRRSMNVS